VRRCFTPKYRRFLDIITYPRGSRNYSAIVGCECLHPVYGNKQLDLKEDGQFIMNAKPKHCVDALFKETGSTFNRIASLYARFYALRFVALLLSAQLRKAPTNGAVLSQLLSSSMKMTTASTIYLYLHMTVHRYLMCCAVPKPLHQHPVIYWIIASIAASAIVLEDVSRVKSINRMLFVMVTTEFIQDAWRAWFSPARPVQQVTESKAASYKRLLNVHDYPGLPLLAAAVYLVVKQSSAKSGRLTVPWKTFGFSAVSALMM
jgi:hypothetical protein